MRFPALLIPLMALPLGLVAQETWSPDTATFTYTSMREGNAEIYRQVGVRGVPDNLTRNPAQDHSARTSPDGRWIVFQSLRDGNREIYLMPAAGGEPTNLTRDPEQDILPEWFPDGRILFFSTRGEPRGPNGEFRGNLYAMNRDGSGVTRLTAEPLTSSFGGHVSPDGRRIAFAREAAGDIEVFQMDADGSAEQQLTRMEGGDYGARFSPDGRWIAFHHSVGDEARIMIMAADGSDIRTLTTGGQHYGPVWSPDGRWILFSGAPLGARQFDLLLAPAAGGTVRPLVATEVDERSGEWGGRRTED
ncbi:MAG: hypothetical protein AB7I33_13705 [Gemmatimonadales bacterium]